MPDNTTTHPSATETPFSDIEDIVEIEPLFDELGVGKETFMKGQGGWDLEVREGAD